MRATCIQVPGRSECARFPGTGGVSGCKIPGVGVGTQPGSSARVVSVLNHEPSPHSHCGL